MQCWAVINGGYNYSPADWTDAEHYTSLCDAESSFWHWVETPLNMADETTEMFVFLYNPAEVHDPYPDFRIYQGPRGGIRRERV